MKQQVTRLYIGAAALLLIFSFTLNNANRHQTVSGKYGVCNCGESADSNSNMLLNIKEDNTFTYSYIGKSNQKREVTGVWRNEKNSVVLSQYPEDAYIPDVWKFSKDYPCIKARKGLNFIRLCSCK